MIIFTPCLSAHEPMRALSTQKSTKKNGIENEKTTKKRTKTEITKKSFTPQTLNHLTRSAPRVLEPTLVPLLQYPVRLPSFTSPSR